MSALLADVSAANGKERRAEAAAACLGCLARQDAGLPRREELIKACVGVGSVRDPELHLAVSEALTGLAAWGVADVLAPVLEKADDHSPHIRSAAALWLLGLVSDVDRLPALRPKLIDIQVCDTTAWVERVACSRLSPCACLPWRIPQAFAPQHSLQPDPVLLTCVSLWLCCLSLC